jgi:hypothetical protein
MMMAGNALAATDKVFVHGFDAEGSPDPLTRIILRDANGTAISSAGTGPKAAFSVKETCGACHDGSTLRPSNGEPLLSYDQIEQGSYHAQMGANNLYGWKTASPGDKDAFRAGKAPAGKAWVQSKGHFGKW